MDKVFTQDELKLTHQAFNALMKVPNVDAVSITYQVGAIVTKMQGLTEGIEQIAKTDVPPAKRRKNGKGATA